MRLKFVLLRVETEALKQLVHDHNDVHIVGDQIRRMFLENPETTFQKLEETELYLQDLITAVLMIEKLEDNPLDNGLDLRHRLFSENPEAIILVNRFLKDPKMTIENLK